MKRMTTMRALAATLKIQFARFALAKRDLVAARSHLAESMVPSFDQVERCLALSSRGAGNTLLSGGLEWRVSTDRASMVNVGGQ